MRPHACRSHPGLAARPCRQAGSATGLLQVGLLPPLHEHLKSPVRPCQYLPSFRQSRPGLRATVCWPWGSRKPERRPWPMAAGVADRAVVGPAGLLAMVAWPRTSGSRRRNAETEVNTERGRGAGRGQRPCGVSLFTLWQAAEKGECKGASPFCRGYLGVILAE